jgi:prevent-host-death family protein
VKTDTTNLVSMTELSRNVSKFINEAAEGEPKVILKNNKVAAVIVSAEHVRRIDAVDELAEDLQLWALGLARWATDSGERHDLDDVIADLGIDLDEDDDEVE